MLGLLALVTGTVACNSVGSGGLLEQLDLDLEAEMGAGLELELEQIIHVVSSLDGTEQPSRLRLPQGSARDDDLRPLVVSLHWWSNSYLLVQEELEEMVLGEGWVYVAPNYRGPNDRPEACGSQLAQQDILDVVDYLVDGFPIDPTRVFITGVSGGGHMTMLMAGRHPDRWRAASAWAGVSDLIAWQDLHTDDAYGRDIRACTGGLPDDSDEVLAEYEARSPLYHLAAAAGLALDIATGRDDGHEGNSVPIHHSLDAFNVIADAIGAEQVSAKEIAELSLWRGVLSEPRPQDTEADEAFGREIFLRRHAGPARVTIFEGGHEGISAAAVQWFREHL